MCQCILFIDKEERFTAEGLCLSGLLFLVTFIINLLAFVTMFSEGDTPLCLPSAATTLSFSSLYHPHRHHSLPFSSKKKAAHLLHKSPDILNLANVIIPLWKNSLQSFEHLNNFYFFHIYSALTPVS